MLAKFRIVAGKRRVLGGGMSAIAPDHAGASYAAKREMVGHRMSLELRCLHSRSRLEQQDFEAMLREHLGSHATRGAGPHYQHVIDFLLHIRSCYSESPCRPACWHPFQCPMTCLPL